MFLAYVWSVHAYLWTRSSSLIDATVSMLRCPLLFSLFERLCPSPNIIQSSIRISFSILYASCCGHTLSSLSILPFTSYFFAWRILHVIIILHIGSLWNTDFFTAPAFFMWKTNWFPAVPKGLEHYLAQLINQFHTSFFLSHRLMNMFRGRLWTTGPWSTQT